MNEMSTQTMCVKLDEDVIQQNVSQNTLELFIIGADHVSTVFKTSMCS